MSEHRTREVDERGNCSKCGGIHFGSGWYCPMPADWRESAQASQDEETKKALDACERDFRPGAAPVEGLSAEHLSMRKHLLWVHRTDYHYEEFQRHLNEIAEAYALQVRREVEYWESRAKTAEVKVLTFHEEIAEAHQVSHHLNDEIAKKNEQIATLTAERDVLTANSKRISQIMSDLGIIPVNRAKDGKPIEWVNDRAERAESALREARGLLREILAYFNTFGGDGEMIEDAPVALSLRGKIRAALKAEDHTQP